MASVANLVDHGILEEDDTNFFVPSDDWRIAVQGGWTFYHAERTDTNTVEITREGKYEDHPVIHTVGWDEDFDFTLFQRVDPSF